MKKLIRLTESDLHRIVKDSVIQILKESGDTRRGAYLKGRALGRRLSKGDTSSFDQHDLSNSDVKKGVKHQVDYESAPKHLKDINKQYMQAHYDLRKREDDFRKKIATESVNTDVDGPFNWDELEGMTTFRNRNYPQGKQGDIDYSWDYGFLKPEVFKNVHMNDMWDTQYGYRPNNPLVGDEADYWFDQNDEFTNQYYNDLEDND